MADTVVQQAASSSTRVYGLSVYEAPTLYTAGAKPPSVHQPVPSCKPPAPKGPPSHQQVYKFNASLIQDLGFKTVKSIGSGFSGTVYLAQSIDDDQHTVALKLFDLSEEEKAKKMARYFFQEVSIIQELHHPHIIRNITPIQSPTSAAICMQFHPLGSLDKSLGKLEGQVIFKFFQQLVSACLHIHSKDIIHRDIKCANILVKNWGHILLCDFGMACHVPQDGEVSGSPGTVGFMAPEVQDYRLTKMPYDGKLADSYACGVVLWSLLFGQCPKENTDLVASIHYISKDGLPEDDMRLMALKLLEKEPEDRSYLSYAFPPGMISFV